MVTSLHRRRESGTCILHIRDVYVTEQPALFIPKWTLVITLMHAFHVTSGPGTIEFIWHQFCLRLQVRSVFLSIFVSISKLQSFEWINWHGIAGVWTSLNYSFYCTAVLCGSRLYLWLPWKRTIMGYRCYFLSGYRGFFYFGFRGNNFVRTRSSFYNQGAVISDSSNCSHSSRSLQSRRCFEIEMSSRALGILWNWC